MKVIKLIILLFLGVNFSAAQIAFNDASMMFKNDVIENLPYSHISNESMKYSFSPELNLLATGQIKTYCAEQVRYPELMITNGIEGQAVIQIVLSGNGHIEDYVVVKSPHEMFTEVINNAMKQFKKVDTKGKDYHGFHKVFLALDFAIVN